MTRTRKEEHQMTPEQKQRAVEWSDADWALLAALVEAGLLQGKASGGVNERDRVMVELAKRGFTVKRL